MRLFIIWTILRKELVETLRDRRTLSRLLLIPILLYPLFAIGVSKLQGSASAEMKSRASKVAVWGELPADLEAALKASGKISLLPWSGVPAEVRRDLEAGALKPPPVPDLDAVDPEEQEEAGAEPDAKKTKPLPARWSEPENPVLAAARALVSKREVEAVIVPWPGFSGALRGGWKAQISVYFDSVRDESMLARERLERALRIERGKVVAEREVKSGLAPGFSVGIEVLPRNVAPESRKVGQILGSMMPMMLILMSLLGGFLPAIDLTAGEKERGTMQTLLCAPLLPIEIIWGKFLAVWGISLLTALANVVSLAFTLRRILPGEVPVAPSVYALAFVLLVPVTFLFAALFLGLAVFAKDFKDGQNVLMPAYLPLALLSGLTMLPGIELNAWTAFAPVLNVALLIKAIFLGDAAPDLIFLALGSSALYASLALLLAARVFEREHVLLGGRESARALFGLSRRQGGEPTAAFSLTAFASIQVVAFYGSLVLARLGTASQLLATELGFFLLPAVACVAGFGFSLRGTFALRLPSPRGALAALLLGASAGAVALGTVVRLVPIPESVARKLGDLLLLEGQPFPVVVLLLAVMPAVCEEVVFRGLLFSGLRRLGPAAAVIISALLFGLAHGSIYRLLPTAFLGLVLGYTRLRTGSIWSGMVVHALNNGLAMALLYYQPSWADRVINQGALSWPVTLGAIAIFAAGIFVLPRGERRA